MLFYEGGGWVSVLKSLQGVGEGHILVLKHILITLFTIST